MEMVDACGGADRRRFLRSGTCRHGYVRLRRVPDEGRALLRDAGGRCVLHGPRPRQLGHGRRAVRVAPFSWRGTLREALSSVDFRARIMEFMACRLLRIDKPTIRGKRRVFIMEARSATFSKSGSVENRGRSHSRNLSRRCVWRCTSVAAWLLFGSGFFSLKAATLPAGFTES